MRSNERLIGVASGGSDFGDVIAGRSRSAMHAGVGVRVGHAGAGLFRVAVGERRSGSVYVISERFTTRRSSIALRTIRPVMVAS
jgi:hypothetical protein